MNLGEFIEKVTVRPLPQNPMARVRVMAKELAEGSLEQLWLPNQIDNGSDDSVTTYFDARWKTPFRGALILLQSAGYYDGYSLTRAAFDLVEEVEPTNIFISYKRSESSAFALLVMRSLKSEGLAPFLDLDLVPGEDWELGLKKRIEAYEYFIVLLGQHTLESEVCQQEIMAARAAKLHVIPVCHNGFEYKYEDWGSLPTDIRDFLKRTHYIKVQVESAAEYDKALTLLLNRFGITP